MKKFAVAIYNNFSAQNKVQVVESLDELTAIKLAYIASSAGQYQQDAIDWMEHENIVSITNTKDLIAEFFNSDLSVGIVEIEN